MSGLKTLAAIKQKVRRLAAIIRVPAGSYLLPTYGRSADFARPHIEVDSAGYHYVVVERGQEQSRYTTSDYDDLLYQIFQSVTFNLACDYERTHRVAQQDCRRILFRRQLDLLSQLSDDWARRRTAEQRAILRKHPFDDLRSERATLTQQLREAGHSPRTARRMACEQYPEPRHV